MPGGPTDPQASCPAPHISPLALCVSQGGCELAKKFFQNFFAHSLRIHRVGFPSRKMPPLPPTRKFCWPSRPGRLPNIQYLRII